jgi:predicted DsbA family dithiol-disulfide isomerase
MSLSVEVISDVICPWCFIGKRRLETAIAAYAAPMNVQWLPFQLNPTMPTEGISRREYRTRKFGSWERSQELDARVIEVGREAGIDFAFDRIARTPNTLNAHRLIWLADKNGVQDAVVEALFRAYFTQGRDISNHQTLSDVVVEAGLDRSKVEALLHSDQGMDAMKDAAKTPRRFRVDSVPFFIVDGTITLSGAQERNVFVEAFKQAEKIGD